MMNQDLAYMSLLGVMESAINHGLQLDPATLKRLGQLAGKVIEVHCTAPNLTVFLRPHQHGLIIQSRYEHRSDCRISGSLSALLKLMTVKNKNEALFSPEIDLAGNTALSQQLQTILADLDLDWEGRLAEYIGDIPAHLIGSQTKNLYGWSQQAWQSLLLNIEEYIHEEARTLPPEAELEPFYRRIDKLTIDTDRLTARLQRLQQTLAEKSP